jgi:predicted ester cyclase
LFAPNYTIHQAGQSIPATPEFLRQSIGGILSAFPDLRMSLAHLIAEGDLVVANWTNRGTQTGEFQVPGQPGLPASGREVTFTESATFRIADSKIAEVWYVSDRLTMMQQLGAISSAGPR